MGDGATVVRGGRVLDPSLGIDRVADVVIENGCIVGVDAPAPPDATVVDATGSVVTAGWIDSHTHVFGDIGLEDPDTAGVLAGVTAVIDAGSSGSLTVDELVEIGASCRTDLYALVYLDRRGIADTGTIPTDRRDLPVVPVGELLRAIERNADAVVGVKTGIYADLGPAWAHVAIAVAELLGQRAYFHVGNFPTHRTSDVDLMRQFLDVLRAGDVVTHCYTAQPGGLLGERGALLPEALAARDRGVAFDLGHSGAGFDFAVARRAIDAGLVPTTVSSDVSVVNVRQRVRNLAHVMGKVRALGFGLADVVRMVTSNPCSLYGIAGGSLASGGPGDLTIFDVVGDPTVYDDPQGNILTGPCRFEVRGCVKAGRYVPAKVDAVFDGANLRSRPVERPAPVPGTDERAAEVVGELARCLRHLPLDGEVVHLTLLHLAREHGVRPSDAARAVRRAFIQRDNGNQAGWLVVEECTRRGRDAVVERLRLAADVPTRISESTGAVA